MHSLGNGILGKFPDCSEVGYPTKPKTRARARVSFFTKIRGDTYILLCKALQNRI